jgi:hypothetical protein
MSVYNGERFLSEAIQSVLNQSFSDFEFIIINDGSTDGTLSILESHDDARIVLVSNQANIGLSSSLNKGLALAQGEYVARMDADDVALPHRFEKQVAFLDAHPEVGILGSPCQLINIHGREQGLYRAPPSDLEIRWRSLIANPFWHPTVMIRGHILAENGLNYDQALQTSQDYDLWIRMLNHTRGANLGEPLIQYRLGHGITKTRRKLQLRNHDTISLRTIRQQLPEFDVTLDQVGELRALFVGGGEFTPVLGAQRIAVAHLYLDLLETFQGHYTQSPDLHTLQRQQTLRVARLFIRPPFRPECVPLLRRLVSTDPGMFWPFLNYAWASVGRWLRQSVSDSLGA